MERRLRLAFLSLALLLGNTYLLSGQSLQIPEGGGASQVSLPAGKVSNPYSATLVAINGKAPYSWLILGGAAPSGLTLSASGVLSGVPNQPGGALFTARVTDSSGAFASSVFAVTIAPQALAITSISPFPNAIIGSSYPAQVLTASGGIPPYTFQITGNLPSGLTFSNGQLSGTIDNSGVTTLAPPDPTPPTVPSNPNPPSPITPAPPTKSSGNLRQETTAGATGTFNVTVTATDSGFPPQTVSAPFQLTVNPQGTDLLIGQAALSFSLTNGATGLPPGARIPVQSNDPSTILHYKVAVSPAVPWLSVTSGGTTPGALNISLTSQALPLPPGVSQTVITVTCSSPSPCAGSVQTITVYLNIASAPAQLSVSSSVLSFSASSANPQALSQTLGLQNIGGGTITVASVTADNGFVAIANVPATVAAGPAVPVAVTVNPAGLAPGLYQSTISIVTSAGTASVPLTLLISPASTMTLNPSGAQFVMQGGGAPGNPNGSFQVTVTGSTTIGWTAAVLPGASWLTLKTLSGTSTAANPGTVAFSINPAAASLTPQTYSGAIQVTSGSVVDSPQTYVVILNVVTALAQVTPNPQPAGLLFTAGATGLPQPQTVQIFASSASPQIYQASSDSSWLSVSPAFGSASSALPGASNVSVNINGLAAGVYTGGVSYAFSSAAVRTVNVTLVVETGAAPAVRSGSILPRATCVPTHLVATQTGLVNSFAQPVAWPAALTVLLVNDCGQPVSNGQVVAAFSNGDSPLALNPTDTTTGTYSGTWTPRNANQQITITVSVTAPAFSSAIVRISGQVQPNAAPTLNLNGTLDAFAISAQPGVPLAPGTIVQIYGSNLASQITRASTIPLPTDLNHTSVIIGGILAPLYYVAPGQINAQVPFELLPGKPYQVLVSAAGTLSTAIPIQLSSDAPGIAQFTAGQIIAQHPDGSLVLETSPAAPGEYLVMYVAGMGLTNQDVPSGTASPSAKLASALDAATITLNGVPVTNFIYAGLTPTLVGLYQINFQIPANVPNGDLQLVLTQTSGVSNSTILPVRN